MIGVTGLTNMLPSSSADDIKDSSRVNTVLSAKSAKHTPSRDVLSPDFTYLFSSENSAISTFTTRVTAFLYSVLGILLGSAKKQVIRTHTWGIVATMAYLQIIRNWAIGKLIGYTVSKLTSTGIVYYSISLCGRCACPSPTTIRVRAVNFTPEADFKGFVYRHLLALHLGRLAHQLIPFLLMLLYTLLNKGASVVCLTVNILKHLQRKGDMNGYSRGFLARASRMPFRLFCHLLPPLISWYALIIMPSIIIVKEAR